MEHYQQESVQQDILTDFETSLIQASGGKRFVNYLIDIIVFYVLVFLLSIAGAFISGPESIDQLADSPAATLISLLLYVLYLTSFETMFKGRTIGKWITGTRAVNEDGSNISAKTAFLRALCRLVPFNVFSALGSPCYPWHDRWTESYVIDVKKSGL